MKKTETPSKSFEIMGGKILVRGTYAGKPFEKIYLILKLDKVEQIKKYLSSGNVDYIFSDCKKLEEIEAIQSRDWLLEEIA